MKFELVAEDAATWRYGQGYFRMQVQTMDQHANDRRTTWKHSQRHTESRAQQEVYKLASLSLPRQSHECGGPLLCTYSRTHTHIRREDRQQIWKTALVMFF